MKALKRTIIAISLFALLVTVNCFGVSAKEVKVKSGNFVAVGYTEDNYYSVSEYLGKSDKITVPAKIKGKKMNAVGFPFLSYNQSVRKVIISDGIETISSQSAECSAIETLVLGASIKEIRMGAFYNCTSLKTVSLSENLESLTYACFNSCTALESIAIPEKTTDVGDEIFAGCTALEKVYLPKSVTNIGYGCFSDCGKLSDVYYGGSESEWKKISISDMNNGNDDLHNSRIHFNHKHTLDNGTVDEPTKDCAGTKMYRCTQCGMVVKTEILKAASTTVEGLRATNNKTASVKIAWDSVSGADKYEVQYSNDGKEWKKAGTTDKCSFTLKKLKAGTAVFFRVRAVAGGKNGDFSDVLETAASPKKTTLKATSQQVKKVNLKWKDVNGETGYQIQYKLEDGKKYKKMSDVKADTVQTVKKKLKSGKTYNFRIRAFIKVGDEKIYGAWSKVVKVKVR